MKINRKFFVPLLSGVLAFSACTDGFEEMNVDPNAPAEVPASSLLTTAQKQLVDNIWDQWFNGRFGMLYAQYWAQNEYTEESRYQLREGTNNTYWNAFYRTLNNLEEIIRLNDANDLGAQSANQRAVARILQVWQFQLLTDIWGPVPYSEALNLVENRSPAYDSQQDIYNGLLAELNLAISEIDPSAPSFASGDLVYGGDMNQWLKFANSLKMRVAIRIADVQPDVAEQAIQQAWNNTFESIEDAALFEYMQTAPNNNPINQAYLTRRDFAVSENLMDYMKETDDPRIPFYADPNAEGEYVGLEYGLTQSQAGAIQTSEVSLPSSLVRGATTPAIYMEYSEVLFIKAEAAQRWGLGGGSAETYYNDAIEASIQFWASLAGTTVSDIAIQNVIESEPYSSSEWENRIGRQKWVALYMQGLQGWIEWRRLDFEGVIEEPSAGSLVPGVTLPYRYTYPNLEASLNTENFDEAVRMLDGANTQATRVWWDVQ